MPAVISSSAYTVQYERISFSNAFAGRAHKRAVIWSRYKLYISYVLRHVGKIAKSDY